MFFLTAADTERLNIRGSRDPLGLVPIWGDFGRKVVENLTGASNSARGFTTLLLGLHFAERVSAGLPDRESVRLAAFLKFEQLAGFARFIRNEDANTRGITQIKKRLSDGEGRRIRSGAAQELQILSNQTTYGIWGLFITPAIDSGLVVPKDLTLTAASRELLDRDYLPMLRAGSRDEGATIETILSKAASEVEPQGRHAGLFEALGKILSPSFRKAEQQFYHTHLILGGEKARKQGWQPRFAELMEAVLPKDEYFDHRSLTRLIKAANAPTDGPLRDQLVRIRDLEGLLVASANLFGFLQHRDKAKVLDVVKELRKEWGKGLRHVRRAEIADMAPDLCRILGNQAAGERLVALAATLNSGKWEEAIDLTLAHNQFVMSSRNGSQPWIQRSGEKLDVRYRGDSHPALLAPADLAEQWRSTFYLNPLKLVSDQLRGRA
ncbi:MAG: hypothetical protein JWM95_32 [Gemmatimonadetes bacterium]|nr:hypothetical protein [Gemmatimonadota bacterium]